MELPQFKYHPDPLSTGSIEPSEKVCEVCNQARGFAYTGSPYGKIDLNIVCPWCIADGSAHAKFGVEFTDSDGIGAGDWEKVASEVVEEVAYRTPGFSGWQPERWFTHCGDAAKFLGTYGKQELQTLGEEALRVIREESGYDGQEWLAYFNQLDRNYISTAYLFKCLHCGRLGGYSDCH